MNTITSGPTTDGQKAFKKLHDCLIDLTNTEDGGAKKLMDYYFVIASTIATFNTHYCSCVSPYDDTLVPFTPIFLIIQNTLCRLANVSFQYDIEAKKMDVRLHLFCESGIIYNNNGDKTQDPELDLRDDDIWDSDSNLLRDEIFKTSATVFNENAVGKSFKLDLTGVPPFLYMNETKNSRIDATGTLLELLGVDDTILQMGVIPKGIYKASSTSIPASLQMKDSVKKVLKESNLLTEENRELLRNFLFGPPDISYLEQNISKKAPYVFDFTARLRWVPEIPELVALSGNKALIDYVKGPSNIERSIAEYVPGSIANQNSPTGGTPTGSKKGATPSRSDGDDGATVKKSDGGNNTKPGDGKQQIINNTSPSKSDMNFERLMKFNKLLKTVTPIQFDTKYLAIVKLLNMFNYVHCSEVSPAKDHVIEPIFVQFDGTSYRVCRVYIKNYQFVYDCRDTNGTQKIFGAYGMENLTIGDSFVKDPPGKNVSFIYMPVDPIYGEVHYKYKPGITYGETITCLDTNGLYKYIGSDRWYVNTNYVSIYNTRDTFGSLSVLNTKENSYRTEVMTNPFGEQEYLGLFLFDTDSGTTLDSIVNGLKQWTSLSDEAEMVDIESTLDQLKNTSPVIYNALSLPETSTLPLPNPIQQGRDVKTLISQVPRAKLLYEELAKLEKNVTKLKSANSLLTLEMKYNNDVGEAKREYYAQAFGKVQEKMKDKTILTSAKDMNNFMRANQLTRDQKVKELTDNFEKSKSSIPDTSQKAFFSSNIDVMVNHDKFSQMIRENIYKGKYTAEVIITADESVSSTQPVLHMKFMNINTYTDENNKMVYGARCSNKSKQVFNTESRNRLKPPKNGRATVRISDDQNRIMKESVITLSEINTDDHRCMLKADDTRLFFTRDEEGPDGEYQMKMVIVDV